MHEGQGHGSKVKVTSLKNVIFSKVKVTNRKNLFFQGFFFAISLTFDLVVKGQMDQGQTSHGSRSN